MLVSFSSRLKRSLSKTTLLLVLKAVDSLMAVLNCFSRSSIARCWIIGNLFERTNCLVGNCSSTGIVSGS